MALENRTIDVRDIAVRAGFDGVRALLAYLRARQQIDWESISSGDSNVVEGHYFYYDWETSQCADVPVLWRDVSRQGTWLAGFRVPWNHWQDKREFWTLERPRSSYERLISDDYNRDPLVDEENDLMVDSETHGRSQSDVPSPLRASETPARSESVRTWCVVPVQDDVAAQLLRFPLADLEVRGVTLRLVQEELGDVRERCILSLLAVDEAVRQRECAWQELMKEQQGTGSSHDK